MALSLSDRIATVLGGAVLCALGVPGALLLLLLARDILFDPTGTNRKTGFSYVDGVTALIVAVNMAGLVHVGARWIAKTLRWRHMSPATWRRSLRVYGVLLLLPSLVLWYYPNLVGESVRWALAISGAAVLSTVLSTRRALTWTGGALGAAFVLGVVRWCAVSPSSLVSHDVLMYDGPRLCFNVGSVFALVGVRRAILDTDRRRRIVEAGQRIASWRASHRRDLSARLVDALRRSRTAALVAGLVGVVLVVSGLIWIGVVGPVPYRYYTS
jgi:hypothetical protein